MLRQIDPPLGFGKKCPERMAYKKLIRMNMPMDKEGKVSFRKKVNLYLKQFHNLAKSQKKDLLALSVLYICARTQLSQ